MYNKFLFWDTKVLIRFNGKEKILMFPRMLESDYFNICFQVLLDRIPKVLCNLNLQRSIGFDLDSLFAGSEGDTTSYLVINLFHLYQDKDSNSRNNLENLFLNALEKEFNEIVLEIIRNIKKEEYIKHRIYLSVKILDKSTGKIINFVGNKLRTLDRETLATLGLYFYSAPQILIPDILYNLLFICCIPSSNIVINTKAGKPTDKITYSDLSIDIICNDLRSVVSVFKDDDIELRPLTMI